jgi:hypothetical protein
MDLFEVKSPFFEGSVKEAVEKALANSLLLCVVVVEPLSSSIEQSVWQDAQLAEKMRREVDCISFFLFSFFRSLSHARKKDCIFEIGDGIGGAETI